MKSGHITSEETREKIRTTLLRGRKIPKKKVCGLYEKGKSVSQIARLTGFAISTINKFLRRQGIKIRTLKEQRNLGIKLRDIIIKRGKDNHNYKGGVSTGKSAKGYIVCSILQHNGSRKVTFEHRLIWEKANGKIPENYSIHHLNGIKDDNRLENLALLPNRKHNWDTILQPYKDRIKVLENKIHEMRNSYGNKEGVKS